MIRLGGVLGLVAVVGLYFSQRRSQLPVDAPPEARDTTQRFPEAGIAIEALGAGLRASLEPSKTTTRQVLVRGPGQKVLLRINSIPIYPWLSFKDLGRKTWSWQTGNVHLEPQGRDRPFDGEAWTLAPGPWLVLVKAGRFLVISSETDLFEPAVWEIVRSTRILAGTGMRATALARHALTTEQAKGPPPADLLSALDAVAAQLVDGYPQRSRVVDRGMQALKARSLDHLDALILEGLLDKSLVLMRRQARRAQRDTDDQGKESPDYRR